MTEYPLPGTLIRVLDDGLGTAWGTTETWDEGERKRLVIEKRVIAGEVGQVMDHTAWGTEDEWYADWVRVEIFLGADLSSNRGSFFRAWIALSELETVS